jgi:hypothetical protein
MRVLHQTCAGMDMHTKGGNICLGSRDSEGRCQEDVRSFRTLTRGARSQGRNPWQT